MPRKLLILAGLIATQSALADNVLVAVAADKENGKQKPIAADFVALKVPDRFVFGFGMDACGAWRNLPAIYAMKEEPECSA